MRANVRIRCFLSAMLLLVVMYVRDIKSECANGCSGHGKCTDYDMCLCWRNWMGNDCGERVCQFDRAHADSPKGDLDFSRDMSWVNVDKRVVQNSFLYPEGTFEWYPNSQDSDQIDVSNSAHDYMECSNKGYCNRQTGECECYDGYEGVACQRAACPGFPTQCSGHGVCKSISQLANAAGGNIYKLWDRDSTMGCECDAGYSGPDCNTRACPFGVDPLYFDDVSTVRSPVWDFAILTTGPSVAALTDGADGVGQFSIRYFDNHQEDWLTGPINVGAACSEFMSALYNLPSNIIPPDSLTCTRMMRNNNVTWNGQQGKPGESGTGDPAPLEDDDGHGINAPPEKTFMIRYKLSFWEAGYTILEDDEWGGEIDGKHHDGVQDVALSGYIYRIRFKAATGKLRQPEIETYIDGKRPLLASTQGYRSIVKVWTDGQQPEEFDHFPTHCDGVTIGVTYDKLHAGATSYPNFPTKVNEFTLHFSERTALKRCLGDADMDPNNNIEAYNWDYGNKYYPHIIKLVRRVTTYTDGGYYVALYFDGSEFIFLNSFYPPDEGTYDGNMYDVYTTTGTLALTSKKTETIFSFASKTFFTVRKQFEDDVGQGLVINDGTNYSFTGDLSCDISVIKPNQCWRLGCSDDLTKVGFDTRYPGKWACDSPCDIDEGHRPKYDNYNVEHCLSPGDMFTALNWDNPLQNPFYINLYTAKKLFKQDPHGVFTGPGKIDFSQPGLYEFLVPENVNRMEVFLRGAGGGSDDRYEFFAEKRAGRGAQLLSRFVVTSGSKYYVKVGGKGLGRAFADDTGGKLGGYNGGGDGGDAEGAGGGGATDLRTSAADLSTRLLVAGGGGGGFSGCSRLIGRSEGRVSIGGDGGTPTGFDSVKSCVAGDISYEEPYNSTGGSLTKGGRSTGYAGVLGIGGSGNYDVANTGGSGGGGGGGYYGGGGGSRTAGSGGSSFCHSSAKTCKFQNQTLKSNADGFARVTFFFTKNVLEDTYSVNNPTLTTWNVPHRSYMQTNIITSDLSTNWAANVAVQNDDEFDSNVPSGFHIYKFIPDKKSMYQYSAECSTRGLCGTDGVCKCFSGYTGDACQVQTTLVA